LDCSDAQASEEELNTEDPKSQAEIIIDEAKIGEVADG
jgi:hypothetical protein